MSLFAFFFITLHLISRNVIRLYELIKISKKKIMRSRTSTWFETKVKYQKTMEDGSEKVVSEAYVVDALSFTEAESAIIDEMSVYVSGELKVSGIGKAGYGEIFFSDVDDDDKFCRWCLEEFNYEGETIMMAPASGFYTTPGAGHNQVRVAYVLKKHDLERALVVLGKALEAYPGRVEDEGL
jgi:hypothetical protein